MRLDRLSVYVILICREVIYNIVSPCMVEQSIPCLSHLSSRPINTWRHTIHSRTCWKCFFDNLLVEQTSLCLSALFYFSITFSNTVRCPSLVFLRRPFPQLHPYCYLFCKGNNVPVIGGVLTRSLRCEVVEGFSGCHGFLKAIDRDWVPVSVFVGEKLLFFWKGKAIASWEKQSRVIPVPLTNCSRVVPQ